MQNYYFATIFCYYCLFIANGLAKPFSLDFCMSESFPGLDGQTYREFYRVHSQLGCAERCLQYNDCQMWTWYYETSKCLLFDHETPLNRNITDCTCFTSTRCGGADETTPTLVGGVEPVEVLLEKGPSLGFVPDLPAERQFPVVASIGDKVFLCGGADGYLAAQSTCFYYSFVKGRWIEMEEMPKGALSRSAGVAAYGDFYIVGGQTAEGNATQLVQILNGPSRTWLEGPPLPISLAGHCALRHWDSLYIVGSSQEVLQVFIFNITSWRWSTLGKGQQRPKGRSDFACSFNQDKTQIYVSGGQLPSGQTLREFWAFGLKGQTWNNLPSSLQPRSGHVMTSYRGLPTIVGGVDSDDNALVSMESYVEDLEQWTRLDDQLTNGRKNFRVTRVPSSYLPQS